MQDNQFYEYASSMLVAAGHMITPSPVYINHSSNETIYIDSKKDVVISSIDRALLSYIDNVSLLMELYARQPILRVRFIYACSGWAYDYPLSCVY